MTLCFTWEVNTVCNGVLAFFGGRPLPRPRLPQRPRVRVERKVVNSGWSVESCDRSLVTDSAPSFVKSSSKFWKTKKIMSMHRINKNKILHTCINCSNATRLNNCHQINKMQFEIIHKASKFITGKHHLIVSTIPADGSALFGARTSAGAVITMLKTLRPRQNGRHFPDGILKCIFLNENVSIAI